ncbi:unnamed protein product [Trichobilharzia regenti]|nr:unnamed protein product [Trichobilharzia regenti]
MYLKENIGGLPYDRYLTFNQRSSFSQQKKEKKILPRHRAVFAVFPFWTTMLICLLAVCSQIVKFDKSSLGWVFRGNEQPIESHKGEKRQDPEFSPEHSVLE